MYHNNYCAIQGMSVENSDIKIIFIQYTELKLFTFLIIKVNFLFFFCSIILFLYYFFIATTINCNISWYLSWNILLLFIFTDMKVLHSIHVDPLHLIITQWEIPDLRSGITLKLKLDSLVWFSLAAFNILDTILCFQININCK